ncbi:MAG: DUF3160 domain-containing protein [Treponema sp.]|nr:DUF3160 domain-containing protein [Treponema sp.]
MKKTYRLRTVSTHVLSFAASLATVLAFATAVAFTGCSKKGGKNAQAENTTSTAADDSALQAEAHEEELSPNAILASSAVNAHKAFLSDQMAFADLPSQGVTEGSTAVVASKVCRLYPSDAFEISENGGRIKNPAEITGTEVPFASIVKLTGEPLRNANTEYEGLFLFQDNYNYFYPVEYKGQQGYIFGADLYGTIYGLYTDLEENKITAELYRTGGAPKEFYPYAGSIKLSGAVTGSLEKNRLAIQQTAPQEYANPDDMINLYSGLNSELKKPTIFVTTDLAAHAQHLIFDRLLQFTEETYFLPRLTQLTDNFIAAIEGAQGAPEEAKALAIKYFQVPKALLAMVPEKVVADDWEQTVSYKEKDKESIIAKYPADVQEDIRQIMSASGMVSEIMGTKEDFTQYKPRGHYTKNGLLEQYFRAQMWYGRINFLIAQSGEDKDVEKDSLRLMPAAMLIVDTVHKNPNLLTAWEEVFSPITDLIGFSDDLSFNDVLPLWKEQNVSDLKAWAKKEKNLLAFMKLCHEKLRPPAISGNSLFYAASETDAQGNRKSPMGWKLLGQRFTYDSYVHDQASSPRLYGRMWVTGLDVMKALGSHTADTLLAIEEYKNIPTLKKVLDTLEKEFASSGAEFWNRSYYNQVLNQIRTQAKFEQGAGFYFTESPAWNTKSLLSAHGTWAELRHDTILYVKQSVAEMGGGDSIEPTFRTEPFPEPINYIEPNVPFWECSLASVDKLISVYKTHHLMDDETSDALNALKEVYSKALDIALKECQDKPITEQENKWIGTVARSFANLIFIHTAKGSFGTYSDDPDMFKMACIADIFTNAELGMCLETAVGVPYRLYIPLNDSQGGKRIAIGYGFSYYEFKQPSINRLTDEQWKKTVYQKDADLTSLMPFWEQNCILPDDDSFKLW